ncbi:MAG: polyprenyl synthetase family protein [candidate division WOR-3 bacterium]
MNETQLRTRLAQDRNLIERALQEALRTAPGVPRRLNDAMRYAVLGPGKRLRPILCLEAFRAAAGYPDRAVLPFCCGIEFIHAFSLVHDDLPSMDDDDFRRGRPSLHRRFDEATAILAADALFARAFELLTRTRVRAEFVLGAIGLVCRAVGPAGMTGGQIMDMADKSRKQTSRQRTALVHRQKTAQFIAAALESGALLAGASRSVCTALRRAGLELGELFQITDDLLDAGTDSQDRKPISARQRTALQYRATVKAMLAEKTFSQLGLRYYFLAGLPRLILHRSS